MKFPMHTLIRIAFRRASSIRLAAFDSMLSAFLLPLSLSQYRFVSFSRFLSFCPVIHSL